MLKDIPNYKVEDVALAVVQEKNEKKENIWNVYLINLKGKKIESVLVTSKGYGSIDGEEVKTSTLRHFLEDVPGHTFAKVEPIIDNLFGIHNEYWISFFLDGVMYDKKYVFLAESIKEEHLVSIPLMHKKGVMIL